MLSAKRLSAEAEIFRFVACCGELTGTITLVFLSCRPASRPPEVSAAPGVVTAQRRIPFED